MRLLWVSNLEFVHSESVLLKLGKSSCETSCSFSVSRGVWSRAPD